MKKKLLAMFSIVFVLVFAAAVYAFNQTADSDKKTASCCAKSDSCPLKGKNATTAENHHQQNSCCDKADCCCKGDSCPMKAAGEKAKADCCGGSCPMKNKLTETAATEKEHNHHQQTAGN